MSSDLFNAMDVPGYVVDRDRQIVLWNPAAERVTGYSAAEVVGRRCRDNVLNHCDDEGKNLCRSRCPLLATMQDGESREARVYLHHKQGHRVPVAVRSNPLRAPGGAITGAVEVFHDDSGMRTIEVQLEQTRRRSLTDPLTGLPNRRMLQEAVHSACCDFERYGRRFAVVFADIDHFKPCNDIHGHEAGDQLLLMVGSTLRQCARRGDTVGRWAGDEFLVLVPVHTSAEARQLADRVRLLVSSTWVDVGRHRLTTTLSVGVALARPGESESALINRADRAMLTAKHRGRNATVVA